MNYILSNPPYHTLVPFIFSATIVVLIIYKWKKTENKPYSKKSISVFFLSFFLTYGLVTGLASFSIIQIDYNISRFDYNNDGFVSPVDGEPNKKDKLIHEKWSDKSTNDTGRNFSIFTGFILAFIVAILSVIINVAIKFKNH